MTILNRLQNLNARYEKKSGCYISATLLLSASKYTTGPWTIYYGENSERVYGGTPQEALDAFEKVVDAYVKPDPYQEALDALLAVAPDHIKERLIA